jgi:hypothetical protein
MFIANVRDFNPLKGEYNGKISKCCEFSSFEKEILSENFKSQKFPLEMSEKKMSITNYFSIILIVWSGAIRCGLCNFPSSYIISEDLMSEVESVFYGDRLSRDFDHLEAVLRLCKRRAAKETIPIH